MFVCQTIITIIVGVASWGAKNAIAEIKSSVAEVKLEGTNNANKIADVDKRLGELKADLPLLYVTREDFIRVTDNIDRKLELIINGQKKGE